MIKSAPRVTRLKAPDPLWTFTRKDLQVLQFAFALATGHYGEVYAGGVGANGYPVLTFIAG